MAVEVHDTPSLKGAHPLYSSYTSVQISPVAKLITVSGQVAEDIETGETPSDLASQVTICLARLSACLEDAGATKTDMTRYMYYISQSGIDQVDKVEGDGAALKLIGGIVGKWLEGHRPASCFLRVFGMSDPMYLCEFECMAVVGSRD